MDVISAPTIRAPHGFTTRAGGVSEGAYSSLNLGLSSGDARAPVAENRRRVLSAFGADEASCCACHQVHGARILEAQPSWFEEEADAIVSATPGLLLIVSTADCLPVLFYDPRTGAVAAAHCGWRGTVQRLAAKVLTELGARYGSKPQEVQVAFGPGITAANYQVGEDVVQAFCSAGFPERIYTPDGTGRFLLDVSAANRWQLLEAGLAPHNLWDSGLCTYADPERFYSHRRDAGKTGRHWAVIAATRQS